jgi:hypothetical protein
MAICNKGVQQQKVEARIGIILKANVNRRKFSTIELLINTLKINDYFNQIFYIKMEIHGHKFMFVKML